MKGASVTCHWPRTLFARLFLIMLAGLAASQALSFGLFVYERTQTWEAMLVSYTEVDVPSSVALLDRLPATARPQWLQRLARQIYSFALGQGHNGGPPDTALSAQIATTPERAIGQRFEVKANAVQGEAGRLMIHVSLSDGSPLTIAMFPAAAPLSRWLPAILAMQFLMVIACTWVAVRLATRPLTALADAADSMGPDLKMHKLEACGADEIARASAAFNAMQDRIGEYMTERIQILASISHDLQTPLTRMRLRTDLMDASALRDSLQRDLSNMSLLVREGIAYASSVHAATESAVLADTDALMESLVGEYEDSGQDVVLIGRVDHPVVIRPRALRRVIGNLVDNALKCSGGAEILVKQDPGGTISFSVLDRGPGIPPDELSAVLQPFYRVEGSRGRETGGAGLGLAIAQQLTKILGGVLTLQNRAGGGLEASLQVPARQPVP